MAKRHSNHLNCKNPVEHNHPIYGAWVNLRRRCDNPTKRDGEIYKKITYSKEWKSFINFYNDMHKTWSYGLSIDRIDNKGDYCKENCRWATPTQQSNNTSRNKIVEFTGTSLTLSEWARKIGIKSSTLRQRFYVYKWDIEKCLTFNTKVIL